MNTELLPDTDVLLVSNQTNVRYLSGFIPVEAGHREAQLLLTRHHTYLFTNPLYVEKATQLAKDMDGMEVRVISTARPLSAVLREIADAETLTTIGFEETELTVAEFNRLKTALPDATWVAAPPRIERQRMIKREDELNHIRRACALTDDCYSYVTGQLHPGVSETQIAWQIEKYFRERQAELAFAPIVAFGANASQPHYAPQPGCLLAEDTAVLLDFGARVAGYCADMTRMVFVGTPPEPVQQAYAATLAAQEKALTLLANGERSGAALDRAARAELTRRGYPVYPHSLGHNVGLDIHEGPRLTEVRNETLATGMVFSVEPGLYREGEYGIRIEDLVHLTKDGVEILSHSPKQPANV